MTVNSVKNKGKRALAALLCFAMMLPMLPLATPIAHAAAVDNETYQEKLDKRKEEYKEKFDLNTLLWNETYGGTARNYLYWANGNFGGVAYKNYIHVYAFEGDTICFGSDVYNSQLNIAGTANAVEADKTEIESKLGKDATADIVLIDLDGNRIPYDVEQGGKGHIPNVQTEVLAKTMESPSGNSSEQMGAAATAGEYTYTPLTYHVRETGVYTIEFHSNAYTSDVGNHRFGQTTKNDEFADTRHNFYRKDGSHLETSDDAHSALVAAWDVSVFNEQNQKETGRVYADYLSLQQNGSYNVVETYYVVTTDSYIYRWDWLGNRPNTYNFFADNKGLTDNATGSTLYKSVKELRNANFDYTRFGASFKYPGSANTDESKSYYIFFEMPNTDLEGRLYNKAIQPDPAENIRFVDTIIDPATQTEVAGSYVGMGGYFAFDVKEATTATLVLNFDKLTMDDDSPKEGYTPVTISGPVKPYSTNYFYWDGKDGSGQVIPKGNYKIEDLITLTTKAGEIHFPVHDMEYAPGGFTFTRVSPIYDRNGKEITEEGTILEATKSVIYYDDTAIYYGEHVGSTGLDESGVMTADPGTNLTPLRELYESYVVNDKTGGKNAEYFKYNNMLESNGGEYDVRKALSAYVGGVTAKTSGDGAFIRIGDHSHTTNMIEYYDENRNFRTDFEEQKPKIEYLDSSAHPVAKVGTSDKYSNTTDYGIADFWTFLPAQPVTTKDAEQIIEIIDGDAFNLTGQVFYDHQAAPGTGYGTYDPMADSDTLLSGVTLNLYRKTTDNAPKDGTDYYTLKTITGTVNQKDTVNGDAHTVVEKFSGSIFSPDTAYYELVKPGVTPVSGRYFFTNIPYDKTNGTEFVYEVVRPDVSYYLTSGNTKPAEHHATGAGKSELANGSYALYAYKDNFGAEVQVLQVGGTGGVDLSKAQDNHTVTAVDVGYHYETYTKLMLKKDFSTKPDTALPAATVFEVCYLDSNNHSHIYEERPLAQIENREHTFELLSATMNGHEVKDWYVSAEYYLMPDSASGGTLYKHTFELDTTTDELTYSSFIGKAYFRKLTAEEVAALDYDSYESLNGSGTENKWTEVGEGNEKAPFTAVLDRNVGSAETTITVTNSDVPGVIEILKYTGSLNDHNYLPGATFRLYTNANGDITLKGVKDLIDAENTAALAKLQVGSGSTRDNGRMTFSGLDPQKHYVIREMYPPAGYRAREVLYIVHPATCRGNGEHFHDEQGDMDDEEWETWQLQNLYFDGDRVAADIANIPASGDMAIRKQIEGRAWDGRDRFTFDIAFRDTAGNVLDTADGVTLAHNASSYGITGSSAVRISAEEYDLFTEGGSNSLVGENGTLSKFLADFNNVTNDLIVDDTCDTAQDTISVHGMQDVKVALADTKQSVPLIVNDEIKYNEDGSPTANQHPQDALMNTSTSDNGAKTPITHIFPAAGTYTFTVSENQGTQHTTDYTKRVYTIVVQVTRELDPGQEGAPANLDNSYLHAEVQSMYYQDVRADAAGAAYPSDYSARAYYAGVAPTFTNRYNVQPAVQSTSYAVQVDFSGRLDKDGQAINHGELTENWREDEKFTVTITGDDPVTQDALENGNIYIGGLLGTPGELHREKLIDYNQTNVTNGYDENKVTDTTSKEDPKEDPKHIFRFEELDFRGIEFPVKWEFDEEAVVGGHTYQKGDAVPAENKEEGRNLVIEFDLPTAQKHGLAEAGNYFYENADSLNRDDNPGDFHRVVSRTEDLVYHLTIKMRDDEKGGITYDDNIYEMTITLKNLSGSSLNGIIDEMDLIVTKKDAEGHVILQEGLESYATCKTDQQIVGSFADWTDPAKNFTDKPDDARYMQYYVNSDGAIREVEVEETAGEKHYYIMDDRSNRVEIVAGDHQASSADRKIGFKNLVERGVTFIVKQEVHTGDHTMRFENRYEAAGTWEPVINKAVTGRAWQDDETFTFQLACTKWPGMGTAEALNYACNPLKSAESAASPRDLEISKGAGDTNTGTGNYDPIRFTAPGEYTFTVTETGRGKGIGSGSITSNGDITITVTAEDNNAGGLLLSVTGVDGNVPEPEEKASEVQTVINFVNNYDESGAFNIDIKKTLEGRAWGENESFTFTVMPDLEAQGAIEENKLTVPDTWVEKANGAYYTATVQSTSGSGEARTLEGNLTLASHAAKGATYSFTIEENTDSFADEHIYCAQPQMKLTVTVTSGEEDNTYTGALLTYAWLGETDPGQDYLGSPYTIPFTNRYYVETGDSDGEFKDDGFKVAKQFTGRPASATTGQPEDNAWLSGDTFTAKVEFDGAHSSSGALEDLYFKGPGEATFTAVEGDTFPKTVAFTSDNKDDKAFNFRFLKEGTYAFTVSETQGDMAGVDYDANTYTVTFTVALDETTEALKITRTITGGSEENIGDDGTITFKNTYKATGTWTPKVTKTLEGRPWQEGEQFEFALACTESSGVILPEKTAIQVGSVQQAGGEPFGAVKFTAPGVYHFTITEVGTGAGLGTGSTEPLMGGIQLTVTAEDDEKGGLNLKVAGDGGITAEEGKSDVTTTVSFVNKFSASGSFDIDIVKTLAGRLWQDADDFSFTVTPDEATKAAITGSGATKTLSVSWDADNTGEPKPILLDGKEGGADPQTAKVGTASISSLGIGTAQYKFTISEAIADFDARKLYCAQPNVELTVNVAPEKSGGVFTGGYTYSATYAYLNESGIAGDSISTEGPVSVPFTNYAAAVAVPEETTSSLTVRKVIDGRSVWLGSESYTAELSLKEGKEENVRYSADGETYDALPASMTHDFTALAHDDWTLDLRFFAAGTYTFAVREQAPAAAKPGIICDLNEYSATYVVEDQGGTLTVTSCTDTSGSNADGTVTITNSYTPKPAVWMPSVTKVLNGREWLTNDRFDFKLAPAADTPREGWAMEPAENIVAVDNKDASTASFAPVTFTKPGTYTFTISETNLSDEPAITPDAPAGAYFITVTVKDDANAGELTLAFDSPVTPTAWENTPDGWQYATGTVFVNTYSQQPGQFTLNLQKTLSGRAWQEGEGFTFTVTPDAATKAAMQAPEPALEVPAEWGPDGNGNYTFTLTNSAGAAASGSMTQTLGDVKVNKEGLYNFTIEETASTGSDTWSPEPKINLTVRATPETDASGLDTGKMVVTTYAHTVNGGSIGHNADDGTTTVPFVNTAYAGTDLVLHKTYTDSTSSAPKAWDDGSFQAVISLDSAENQVMCNGTPLAAGHAMTIPLKNDGQQVALRFFAEGTYGFTVREFHGGAPGVTYDGSVYTVTVTVAAGSDGVLTATPLEDITFANTYREARITGGLTVTKTVVGEDTSGTFDFTVTLSGNGADMVDGEYGGMTFHSGVARFQLGHNGATTATGLPAGIRYTVTEETTEGYTSSATGATGSIPASGSVTAAFVNTKGAELPPADENTGSLTVAKTVTGKAGELERDWNFTITLSDAGVNGLHGEVLFTNGVAHFTLRHDCSITASGLPAGAVYTVTEAEAGQEGYDTSASMETGTIPYGGTATAVFVNHRDKEPAGPTGTLTVTKMLVGTAAEADRETDWEFTVKLSGDGADDVTGTYSGVEFMNGTASLTARHGETKVVAGLPAGLDYTVSETLADADGYTTTSTNATGVIEEDRTVSAVFTNTKNAPPAAGSGYLTVTKTVTGNAAERDRAFTFTIDLSAGISGDYNGTIFADGKATVYLRHGESYTIELPADTAYTVTEEETAYTMTCTGETGKVPAGGTAVAAFANDRQSPMGSLTVSKTVSGTDGDADRVWHFQVELGDETVNGEHGGVSFTNGKADITLKHGQSVTIIDLPAGISYAVTEQEADQDGYATTAVGSAGYIPANDTALAAFENHRDAPSAVPGSGSTPETGDPNRPGLWLALMLFSLAGLIVTSALYIRDRELANCKSKRRKNR